MNLPTEHLSMLYKSRDQDAVFFVEGEHVEALVSKLAPAMFRSPCPVFLPENYTSLIDLRLDSNVILYEETGKQFERHISWIKRVLNFSIDSFSLQAMGNSDSPTDMPSLAAMH